MCCALYMFMSNPIIMIIIVSIELNSTANQSLLITIVVDLIHKTYAHYNTQCIHLQTQFLSYYVTQCFQHIYLATSTLWGADGQSVFGSNFIELTGGITTFRWVQRL